VKEKRVVIIGGGVIGAACAHFLAESNWSVTIIDKAGFGKACSHANCGLIALSHVLPLNEPGAIKKTFKALLSRNSPFKIKPRFDLSLWSWLLKFARRCNHRDMMEFARARAQLIDSSARLFPEILDKEGIECEWEQVGCLFVYQSKKGMDGYAATDKLLRDEFNVGGTRYDGSELVDLEPALVGGLGGAWHYEMDCHLRPDKLMSNWKDVLIRKGVEIKENCELTAIHGNGSASSISTNQGEISADAFLVATGAVTPLLNKHLGCKIPIQPGKGYSITMPRPEICPRIPMLLQEHKVGVTPFASGYRLGSTMEFSGYDETLNSSRMQLLRDGAADYLHEPFTEPVEEEWYGWRPMTYDGKPIIDRSPKFSNVWIAAGHNMLGLTMAPGTGKLVAELLNDEKPHVDTKPFSVRRF
jgi:D-amino-acid dehydrogenase